MKNLLLCALYIGFIVSGQFIRASRSSYVYKVVNDSAEDRIVGFCGKSSEGWCLTGTLPQKVLQKIEEAGRFFKQSIGKYGITGMILFEKISANDEKKIKIISFAFPCRSMFSIYDIHGKKLYTLRISTETFKCQNFIIKIPARVTEQEPSVVPAA